MPRDMHESCRAFGPGGRRGRVVRAVSAGSVSRVLAGGDVELEVTRMADREWLSVQQAAEELGLAESTLVRAIDAGRVEALRLGESHKATRIHRAALQPWLREEFARGQAAAYRALVSRMQAQRQVVARMEAELERERRRWVELVVEVEQLAGEAVQGMAAGDGRQLRVV